MTWTVTGAWGATGSRSITPPAPPPNPRRSPLSATPDASSRPPRATSPLPPRPTRRRPRGTPARYATMPSRSSRGATTRTRSPARAHARGPGEPNASARATLKAPTTPPGALHLGRLSTPQLPRDRRHPAAGGVLGLERATARGRPAGYPDRPAADRNGRV